MARRTCECHIKEEGHNVQHSAYLIRIRRSVAGSRFATLRCELLGEFTGDVYFHALESYKKGLSGIIEAGLFIIRSAYAPTVTATAFLRAILFNS